MPELPDLEAVKCILNDEIAEVRVVAAQALPPLSFRHPEAASSIPSLAGDMLCQVERRGKYLMFQFDNGGVLAIHPMLTGRLQYCGPKESRKPKTCFVLTFEDGNQLRYFDPKLMGKVYLLEKGKLGEIPHWKEMGPDALDPALTAEVFQVRIKRYTGQIKNVLMKDTFVAGIGNAYADEILFEAGIYPFWPRPSLSDEEIDRLYRAMRSVLADAVEILAARMKADISGEIRDFLKVHRRGGQPCPKCGHPISQVEANRRITSFCRHCQRG